MSRPVLRDHPPSSLAEAALWWAERGFAVFPLQDRRKEPRPADVVRLAGRLPSSNGNGHEPGGFHQATQSPEILRRWWEKWPTANLGGAVPAGVVVLDLDGPAAEECLAELGYAVPVSFTVRTGRGRHVYFRLPDGLALKQVSLAAALRGRSGFRRKIPAGAGGVELRAAGKGYVLLPPSVHPRGERYEILGGSLAELAEAPEWLWTLFGDRPRASGALPLPVRSGAEPESLPRLMAGERDTGLFRYACQLRRKGLSLAEAELLLRQCWQGMEQPAGDVYPWEKARAKLEAAWRYPAGTADSAPLKPGIDGNEASEGDSVNSVNSVSRAHHLSFIIPPARLAPSFRDLVPFQTSATLPEFPLEQLPDQLRGIVADVAESVQVPVDLPALLALGVTAAACTYAGLWVELPHLPASPVALYLVPVLKPSERKSTVFKLLIEPLTSFERTLRRQRAPEILAAKERHAAEQAFLSNLRRQAREADADEKRAALVTRIAEEAGKLAVPPPEPSLIAGDATPEGLGVKLQEQGGRLSVFDTEGSLLANALGRYSSGTTNFDLLLRCWSGDELRVDRKGSSNLYLPCPVLTICLTIQPEMLRRLGEHRESVTQGLASRFLFAIPASRVGRRTFRFVSIREAARRLYEAALLRVLHLGPPPPDTGSGPARRLVRVSEEAFPRWVEFHDATELELGPGGRLEALADWGGKLPGNVARIAAALHAVQHHRATCERPIDERTMAAAVAIGSYFKAHALAAYELLGADPEAALALRVAEAIAANRWESFSERDLYRPLGIKPATLRPVLATLEERGYLAKLPDPPRQPGKAGQPPSPRYAVRPGAFTKAG